MKGENNHYHSDRANIDVDDDDFCQISTMNQANCAQSVKRKTRFDE